MLLSLIIVLLSLVKNCCSFDDGRPWLEIEIIPYLHFVNQEQAERHILGEINSVVGQQQQQQQQQYWQRHQYTDNSHYQKDTARTWASTATTATATATAAATASPGTVWGRRQ